MIQKRVSHSDATNKRSATILISLYILRFPGESSMSISNSSLHEKKICTIVHIDQFRFLSTSSFDFLHVTLSTEPRLSAKFDLS